MCASFQLIVPYTSHWTWGMRFYEDYGNFSLHFLMETRKAFWRKPSGFSVPTLHCGWEVHLGKKSEHYFEILSSHFTTEDLRAVWAKKSETFEFFSLHFPTDMRSAFGRKNRKLFRVFSVPIFHWSRDAHVVRFSGNFSSSLTWEKCQPPLFHYPLEEKRLFERKKDAVIQIFFSLIYLDRKRLVGRKNLKTEKSSPLTEKALW